MSGIAHGGNFAAAHVQYGEPEDGWLSLPTGANLHDHPILSIPPNAWLCLPEDDGFEAQATAHYGVIDTCGVLPIAGSQAAVCTLPSPLPRRRAGIMQIGHSEHAPAFACADHDVVPLPETVSLGDMPNDVQHLIVVDPNNPTTCLLLTGALRN